MVSSCLLRLAQRLKRWEVLLVAHDQVTTLLKVRSLLESYFLGATHTIDLILLMNAESKVLCWYGLVRGLWLPVEELMVGTRIGVWISSGLCCSIHLLKLEVQCSCMSCHFDLAGRRWRFELTFRACVLDYDLLALWLLWGRNYRMIGQSYGSFGGWKSNSAHWDLPLPWRRCSVWNLLELFWTVILLLGRIATWLNEGRFLTYGPAIGLSMHQCIGLHTITISKCNKTEPLIWEHIVLVLTI